MEHQMEFDISDCVDRSLLIDAADIAKLHLIRLLNEYAPCWKLAMTTHGKSNLHDEKGKDTRKGQARVS